jgi:NhaP-type Na+/H+ or K+/H+ antiporter
MLLGILLGPVFHLVNPSDFGEAGQIFTTLALILVLFKSGLNFRLLSLRGAVGQGFFLTTVCFALVMCSASFLAYFMLGLSQAYAFVIGAIVAGNSPAVIVPMLAKLRVAKTTKTILFLEANLTGVYTIILALAFLSAALHGEAISAQKIAWDVAKSFGIGTLFAVLAGLFWMGILNHVRQLENAVSLTFAFVLLVYSISGLSGADGAIATLVFGITAGNMRLIRRSLLHKLDIRRLLTLNKGEKSFFDEIEFIFKTLFFVYMGICMHLGRVELLMLGLLLVLAKFLFRTLPINYCVSRQISRRDCSVILAMCPNGLVSAVLAAMIAVQLPQEGEIIQDVIYAVIFFSVFISNLMSYRIEKGGLKWVGTVFFHRHLVEQNSKPSDSPEVLQ